MTTQRNSERGAILVYVAIAIVALMSFSAFVMDYGVFWVARHQAQNAADAGALAGALARLFDEPGAPGAITDAAARQAALSNQIFGENPAVDVRTDAGACPAYATPYGNTCVRIDVYRDNAHGNPLPTYFARLLGATTLGVQATATAQLRGANMTECVKPIMLPDLGGTYSIPPAQNDTPGYTLADLGMQITLDSTVNPMGPNSVPGYFREFDAGQGFGGTRIHDAVAEACPSSTGPHAIGELVRTFSSHEPAPGGAILGLQDVINLDPSATWDAGASAVRSSCAPGCGPYSPRIIAIALFNPAAPAAGGDVYIRDFMSVFVSDVTGGVAHVYVTRGTGRMTSGLVPLVDAGFLNVVAVAQ